MRYLITGGTGLVGGNLIPQLVGEGHEVINLSRSGRPSGMEGWENVKWDGTAVPPGIEDIDVVINLAGANVGKRWTEGYKKTIMESRVNATRACVDFINAQAQKPQVFLSASGTSYYGMDYEGTKVESDGLGAGFLAEVCEAWEAEAEKADVRTVIMRISPVLSMEGGPLEKMATPFKMFIGGPTGNGKQGFPWIHLDDLLAAIRFFVLNPETEGPFNLAAPQIISNKVFATAIGKAMGRPSFFKVPKFVLKAVFGEMSIVLWGGNSVTPEKLKNAGFKFNFPKIDLALQDIFAN